MNIPIHQLYAGSNKREDKDIEKTLQTSEAKCVRYKGLYAQQQV